MPVNGRKLVRVVKYLLAGVTVFCVSWIACVNEWHSGVRWTSGRGQLGRAMSTMRTIVAYSEGKQAEMDRPTPLSCYSLPVFPKLSHIDRSWPGEGHHVQGWQHVAGTRVSLYAAYYDERAAQRYVRILASFHGRNYSTENALFCQTRSRNSNLLEDTVEVVAAKPLEIWWHKWDMTTPEVDTPLLLSCPLTEPLYGPSVVSVVTGPCDNPTNAFQLEPNKEQNKIKRLFTICVKDMNFDKDISQSLVEWIETNKILGVDQIDMYIDEVTEKTKRVLLHYQDKGIVRLFHVPIKHKSGRSLWQRRRDHILTYNDCLYRNINESEFIVPLDIDEVILPKIADTWPDLLKRLNKYGWSNSKRSSIMIQNVFFFDFMQGIEKYKVIDGRGVKRKIYTKRDDVRIEKPVDLDIDEIELLDSNYVSNEVIDDSKIDGVLCEKYKSRCGSDLPTPKLVQHVVSSAVISPIGSYSKSWMLTKMVLTAFNHYPLRSLGASGSVGWSAPFREVQLNHYKILCTLSFLATGSYQRIVGVTQHLPQRTASRCIRQVVEALNSDNIISKYIKFPQTNQERSRIRQEFQRRFNLPGVVGCIDCTHIAIIKPAIDEHLYFNRKGYHSLNVQMESCNTTVVGECARYGRRARIDRAALRLRRRLTRALADAICTEINVI